MNVMIEAVLWGSHLTEEQRSDAGVIEHACRICIELGADILKAPYIEDEDRLRALVEGSPVPVVLLGGAKAESVGDVLRVAERAIRAGVRGVVFGRNVWQHPNPERMVGALVQVVHEGITSQEALTAMTG